MKRKLLFLLVALAGVGADLLTKEVAFRATAGAPGARIPVVETRYFRLHWHRVENTGGMFGVAQDHGGTLKYLRLAALGVVLYFFLRAAATATGFLLALSFILAGAVGNLCDSFFNDGRVRDFVEVFLPFMPRSVFGRLFDPWPTFNVADSLIVVGALLLVVELARRPGTAGAGARGEAAGGKP